MNLTFSPFNRITDSLLQQFGSCRYVYAPSTTATATVDANPERSSLSEWALIDTTGKVKSQTPKVEKQEKKKTPYVHLNTFRIRRMHFAATPGLIDWESDGFSDKRTVRAVRRRD